MEMECFTRRQFLKINRQFILKHTGHIIAIFNVAVASIVCLMLKYIRIKIDYMIKFHEN